MASSPRQWCHVDDSRTGEMTWQRSDLNARRRRRLGEASAKARQARQSPAGHSRRAGSTLGRTIPAPVLNRAEAQSFKGLSRICGISPYRSELSARPLLRRPSLIRLELRSFGTGLPLKPCGAPPTSGGHCSRHRLGRWAPYCRWISISGSTSMPSTTAGRTVFSGESPDVVCHELGHALLDSFKPQLFDAASIEVAAFHESFGDMSAILSALQLPSVREGVLAETGGVLRRSSRLSRLAEQLGWAIRQSVPSAVEPDCLRNAVNTF